MGVDNAKVHNHIQRALDDHAIGALTTRLDKSFGDVNTLRSKKCGDLDLAAADHYLLMRFMTNKFSPAVAGPLFEIIVLYDGIYKGAAALVASLGGPEIVFRTGNCPATPFSPLVIAWAETGVSDGILDCVPGGPHWQSSPKIYVPKVPAGWWDRLF